MKEEIWKDIKGYEGLYQVSSFGRIKSFKRHKEGILMNPFKSTKNYLMVPLCKNGNKKIKFVHRLVMENFKPDKTKFKYMPYEKINSISIQELVVNHKDGDKQNNNIDNLEWCTVCYNNCEAIRLGLKLKSNYRLGKLGKECPNSIPVNQYSKNGTFIKRWDSGRDVLRFYNKTSNHISDCCKGKRQTYLGFRWEYADE